MSAGPSEDKLEFIDALRGLAILAVIAYHAGSELREHGVAAPSLFKGGQFGVQLFYVASAFTLCLSHQRRGREPFAVGRFFVRRYFRIAPTYYAGLAAYFVIRGLHEGIWPPAGYDAAAVLANLTFTHGWHPSVINYVVPGGWSIACEMMFYLLLPLMLVWVRSWRSALVWLGLALAVNAFAGWLSFQPLMAEWREIDRDFFYFWLPNQLPVFAFGMLAFFLWEKIEQASVAVQTQVRWGAWLGFMIVGIVAAAMLFSDVLGDWSPIAIAPLCGLCFSSLLIALALGPTPLFVNRLTRSFGFYSYGGYTSHFALLWLLFAGGVPSALQQMPTALIWAGYAAVLAALTWLAAAAVHLVIEQPGINLGRQVIRRWFTPATAAITTPVRRAETPTGKPHADSLR